VLVGVLGDGRGPEVRAACLYVIGMLFGAAVNDVGDGQGVGKRSGFFWEFVDRFGRVWFTWVSNRFFFASDGGLTIHRMEITIITGSTPITKGDMSPMLRKELVTILSHAM